MGEKRERVVTGFKEKPRKPQFRWIPWGVGVLSDPTRGGEYLGTVGEILDKKGVSPKRSEDGNLVCLGIDGGRHIPVEDAYYYWVPQLGGWVLKPPTKTPEPVVKRETKKQVKAGQLGLGGGFSK